MINKITALNLLPLLNNCTITYSGKEDGKIKIIQQIDSEKLKKIIINSAFFNNFLFLSHQFFRLFIIEYVVKHRSKS